MCHATGPIADLAGRVLAGELLDRADAKRLVDLSADRHSQLLYHARRIRTDRFSNTVRLCAIVPGKLGACSEDCSWCAQSQPAAPGVTAHRRIPQAEILDAARRADHDRAARIGIVNSGRKPDEKDLADVLAAARAIQGDPQSTINVCASLGELTDTQARSLAQAGITHYNHNIETSRRMFGTMVSTHGFDDRLRTLAIARQAGLKLCCGGVFGLGETWDDRIDMALTLRDEVHPHVVPLNFLHPIPGTPLQDTTPLEPMEILRIIAVFRFVMPDADIKLAGGREVNLRDLQSWAFGAGATSCLIGDYLTTTGRSAADDLQMLKDLGLEVVSDLPTAPNTPV